MSFFTEHVGPTILANEGGYVNLPADPGGETNWGITRRTADLWGFKGQMRGMTRAQALDIYERAYWIAPGVNSVSTLAPQVAIKLCDIAVNQGPHFAGEFLQVALNALNRRGVDYPDVKVDGDIGPGTLKALDAYVRVRKAQAQVVLLIALRAQQVVRYLTLPASNPALEDFMFGWLLRGGDV